MGRVEGHGKREKEGKSQERIESGDGRRRGWVGGRNNIVKEEAKEKNLLVLKHTNALPLLDGKVFILSQL